MIIILFMVGYALPKVYYGEQVAISLEGPFLPDNNNESEHTISLKLLSGSSHSKASQK